MAELKTVLKDIGSTLRNYYLQQNKKCQREIAENNENLKIIKEFPYVKQLIKENIKLKEENDKLKLQIPPESANLNLEISEINRIISNNNENENINNDFDEDSDEESSNDELFLITLNGTKYYTTDKENGILFEFLFNGLVGKEIGILKNKEPFFNKISDQ